ncbi:hypothetical protein M0805_002181 [Coniferiporia weirii]|nr:hypothetical protein M0805_002181 [Coniferiporia weirii]
MDTTQAAQNIAESDDYALPRNTSEQLRLNSQHEYLLHTVSQGRLIDDPSVTLQLGPGSRVLDSGTGTGVWALALAKEVSEGVEIDGADISSALFPPGVDHPSNVHFHVASATSLPKTWSDRFDLVHQRFLFFALTLSSWKTMLSEAFRVLKPGGSVQLMELLLDKLPKSDEADELKALDKSREFLSTFASKCGFMGDITQTLPSLMKEAGFVNIHAEERYAPLGEGWGDVGRKGLNNFGGAFRNSGPVALKLGLVKSSEEFEEIYRSMIEAWNRKVGFLSTVLLVRATKPKPL